MKLNISCAAKIYQIKVDIEQASAAGNDSQKQTTSSETDNNNSVAVSENTETIATLGALKQKICSLCNINPNAVKILHRGHVLTGDNSAHLSTFNFKENDKLLVLGKPPPMQTDAGWKLLVDFERQHTKNVSATYEKNMDDLTQLEKNFLKDPERREYTNRMDKRLKGFAENCMKLLETLDGLQVITDGTEKEQAQRNREKRKFLVDGIQDALNKNDKLIDRLDNYRNKCENPEEGL